MFSYLTFPMNRNAPVILIEDDLEDQEILIDVLKKSGYLNELICFPDDQSA
jgi:hypothetical protein